MDNNTVKVVLFASSSIVIPTLNQLLQSQHLAGVVLSDRVDEDSMQLAQQLSQANIPHIRYQVEQPENITHQIAHQIEAWQANTGLIFTFGHKLPTSVLGVFANGLFNLHASALPQYRGAMPLYWQIRNRESEGCLSILKVEEKLDSGDIMLQQRFPLHPLDTLNSFGHVMAEHSPGFVLQFIGQLQDNTLTATVQILKTEKALAAPMPTQQDLIINWQTMKGAEIAAMARAGNPLFNGAMIVWHQSFVGLLQATVVDHPTFGVPAGTVLLVGEPEGLIVATIDGALRLDVLTITEGVFSGLAFAERFGLDAGAQFDVL
ncbi:MAG: methionyl-tRNA formyltransferase [Phenylobacterium sp.]|jgi:methionyl-tRNA formyltransferase